LIGDLFVRLSLGDEPQDVDFAFREGVVRRVFGDSLRDGGRQRLSSRVDRSDRVQKVFLNRILQEVSASAGLKRTQSLDVAGIRRQHDDSSVGKIGANRDDRIRAAHFRHLQIHQCQIGTMCAELLNRVAPVGALGNDQHVRLAGDEGLDSSPQQRMIVDGENPNRIGTGAHECACRPA
jgi:hypothetical protein